jgi:DNA modification methylase
VTDHRIILGDAFAGLAGMARAEVDHIVTDPPYSERVHAGVGTERRHDKPGEKWRDPLAFGHLTARSRVTLAREFVRVAKRWIVVFCDEESVFLWKAALERAGAEWCVKGTWVKEGAMPRMDGTRPAYGTEAICIAHAPRTKGRTRWNGGGRVATYYAPVQEPGREHPTQKPLALMEALVSDFTDPGDLVLDPFAGAGSTLVACRRLGRRGLGWEADPRWVDFAQKRIDGAREQRQLFAERGPEPKQVPLLAASSSQGSGPEHISAPLGRALAGVLEKATTEGEG